MPEDKFDMKAFNKDTLCLSKQAKAMSQMTDFINVYMSVHHANTGKKLQLIFSTKIRIRKIYNIL